MSSAFLLGLILGVATAHEYFPEKCPEFTPMQGFDWDQVMLYNLSFYQNVPLGIQAFK